MKIAVPVADDSLLIVKCTGQAPFFAIFNDAEFEKIVEAPLGDGHHSHEEDHDHAD